MMMIIIDDNGHRTYCMDNDRDSDYENNENDGMDNERWALL